MTTAAALTAAPGLVVMLEAAGRTIADLERQLVEAREVIHAADAHIADLTERLAGTTLDQDTDVPTGHER